MKGNSPINTIFGKLVFGCWHYFSHSQSSVLLTYKWFIYLKIYRTAFNIYSDCKSKKQKKKLANIEIFKNIFRILHFTYNNSINWGNFINKGYYNSTFSTQVNYYSLISWFICSKSPNAIIWCLPIMIYLL